ncbi:hypothetical protein A2526_01620 [candidate division WOR-1 bacterium RIFOXYD2_FULL_36_8]|uniref:Knr4/Smi1-like domain-containing protein n=1 Tax=candidate division WOR-1 bacterium RIFOXYB2_FULL_36_35 TaxID=1802578 RepID=A0A1F4SAS3_UNCSA|nr:MAG: hypothetical protein A2230_05715 [candidate division WOR-1 bacterium RIFOXYA2_FULL_36_21]OGC16853.1 MAG: hypothetical protein A2290_05000 [candidate division WOR-1 bacterium RIFOXYB2_FULL_36_35]OGC18680.1 MAG: hypothetical protein A2282_07210 [candidate division WOR-1 bacterium RIFOXYA12_FULL_36_13]OGC41625.1 MAG: hypothetical protein A2526_01620 [candidate division WOR-1 bacterium RIFOXYD2_FULL_36_8]
MNPIVDQTPKEKDNMPNKKYSEVESYFKEHFFDEFKNIKGVEEKKDKQDNVKKIETLFNVQLPPDLKAFIQFIDKYDFSKAKTPSPIQFWDFNQFPIPSQQTNIFENILENKLYLIMAFTNSIFIGSDISGNTYFATVDKKFSEIIVYSPESDEIRFVADSIQSFLYLNHLEMLLDAGLKGKNIQYENIQRKDIENLDFIKDIKNKFNLISKNVNLKDKNLDIITDIDESLPFISGINPKCLPKSNIVDLYKRSRWIINFLQDPSSLEDENLSIQKKYIFNKEMQNSSNADLVTIKIYWLWRLYLLDEYEEFKKLMLKTKKDKAIIVSHTALFLEKLAENDSPENPNNFAAFKEKSTWKNKKNLMGIFQKQTEKAFFSTEKDKQNQQTWDRLCYEYYKQQNWEKMLEASLKSLDINPNGYYAWRQKGIAYIGLKMYEEALVALDTAIGYAKELYPKRISKEDFIGPFLNKLDVLAELKNKKEIFPLLKKVFKFSPYYKDEVKKEKSFKYLRETKEFQEITK